MSAIIEPLDPRLLFAAGDLDASYGAAGTAQQTLPHQLFVPITALQGGDRILVGGSLQLTDQTSENYLVRYTADGQADSSFAATPIIPNQPRGLVSIDAMAVLPDDRIVIAGGDANGTSEVLCLTPSGKVDKQFGKNGFTRFGFEARALGVGADGSIYVGGNFSSDAKVSKLAPNGKIDTTFADKGTYTDPAQSTDDDTFGFSVTKVFVRSDGTIVVGGTAGSSSGGSSTPAFTLQGAAGQVETYDVNAPDAAISLDATAVLSDGSLLAMYFVEGDSEMNTEVLAKYNLQGDPDTTFGENGQIDVGPINSDDVTDPHEIRVDAQGRIVVCFNNQIFRYTSSGKLDPTFGTHGVINAPDDVVGIGADGSILDTSTIEAQSSFTTSRRFSSEGPEGLVTAPNLNDAALPSYEFTVRWRANAGVDISSLNAGLRIVGPKGDSYKAHLLRTAAGPNNTVVAVYKFAQPPEKIEGDDAGTYSIFVRGGQVKDIHGAAASAGKLGTFNILI